MILKLMIYLRLAIRIQHTIPTDDKGNAIDDKYNDFTDFSLKFIDQLP